ncbi:MAG: WD40/YVTN/BNR-like repeat-containing protein, partial [Planctomycetota bacterium]
TDGGKNFVNMGLEDTHQIARVVTHPRDPDIVYVAAIGHLWGYSGDRGLFKTEDGGETWQKLAGGLPGDGKTGATDLVMDPRNPETLYCAFYHRLRQPWVFHSGGPEGGIFKSTNGGRTWQKLSEGLPPGDTGRIGLAIYRSDPRILMAIVEAEQTGDLSQPGSGIYRTEDAGATWSYVNTYNNRPFYYSQIRINPLNDQRVYVLTTRYMVSDDGGKTLRNGAADEEIHGDFHALWHDPNDADRYYIGQDKGAFLTQDHGEHFLMFDNLAMGQYYRIGVDMREPYYVYGGLQDNGTWAGPSFSRDVRGILNDSNWKLHWGDGMFIQIDPADWRKVYTEAEGGSFRQYDPLTHRSESSRPSPSNISNLEEYFPGLANQVNATETGGRGRGRGRGGRQPRLFRFNWTAPLVMSPQDSRTLYLAGNHVFKTKDEGKTWTIISPDLSSNDSAKHSPQQTSLTRDLTGAETHCSITTLSPSSIDENVIWVGTDDGRVHLTKNGGASWIDIRSAVPDVPEGIWVSRIEASHFDLGTAYLSFDGHRSDRFDPWIFRTDDYGQSWQNLGRSLPEGEVIRVVREDLRNPDLLFLGTEFGVWASLDRGASWQRFMNEMPTVPVYDLVIHPRDHDLIAGTHGRSIWIADDISPLQQLDDLVRASLVHLFEQRPAVLWENVSRGGQRGHVWYAGKNPPTIQPTSSLARARFTNSAMITYWSDIGADRKLSLEIASMDGSQKRVVTLSGSGGVQRYHWDLRFDPPPMTEEQIATMDNRLESAMATLDPAASQQIASSLEAFRAASNDAERRQALRSLQSMRFLRGRMGGLPRGNMAGPGSYRLTLRAGENTSQGSIELRADPILEGEGR